MNDNVRMIDGEWQPRGGGCRCRKCAMMVPSEGFFRAPASARDAADRDRHEADNWLEYQIERLPSVDMGPPRESVVHYRSRVAAWREDMQREAAE